jgi:hypothetical protein
VVGRRSRWLGIRLIVEQLRYRAVDEWSVHLCAFYTLLVIRGCHDDPVRPRAEKLTLAWRDVVDQVKRWKNLRFRWWRPLVLQYGQCSPLGAKH